MATIGEQAPNFKAKMYHPQNEEFGEIDLKDLRGKWVVMAFHPADFTFTCATDLEAFSNRYEDFKQENAVILAISTDSIFSHKMWVTTSPRVQKVKFPMIGDAKKEITNTYGFLGEDGLARRGVVILDPDGVIQYTAQFNRRLGKDVDHIWRSFLGLKHIYEHPGTEESFDIIPANWKPGKKPRKVNVPKDVGRY